MRSRAAWTTSVGTSIDGSTSRTSALIAAQKNRMADAGLAESCW